SLAVAAERPSPPVKAALIAERATLQNPGLPPAHHISLVVCFGGGGECKSSYGNHSRRHSHRASTCQDRFLCPRAGWRPLGFYRGERRKPRRLRGGTSRSRSARLHHWSQAQAPARNRRPSISET